MGLFDGIVGNVIGSMLGGNQTANPLDALAGNFAGGSGGNALLQIALSMLQQGGGLSGVLDKFRQAGLSEQADSWVGTGSNLNISANQLQQALGSGALDDVSAKLGMSPDQTGSALSQLLPELINQLTPHGQVTNDSEDSITQGLAALSNSLGR
jgi:uncharacterized protein YidB (DUF937 family)